MPWISPRSLQASVTAALEDDQGYRVYCLEQSERTLVWYFADHGEMPVVTILRVKED